MKRLITLTDIISFLVYTVKENILISKAAFVSKPFFNMGEA